MNGGIVLKKIVVLGMVVELLIAGSVSVFASSFQADGAYLLGTVEEDVDGTAFLLNAEAELYPNVLVEGSFLSGKEKADDEAKSLSLMLAGAKYRVLSETGMDIFVGAVYGTYSYAELEGNGIYGKVGLRFELSPELVVSGDVAYAPKAKFGEDDTEGTLLSGRGSISYTIMENIGVQATFLRNVADDSDQKVSSTLYGGGVVISF